MDKKPSSSKLLKIILPVALLAGIPMALLFSSKGDNRSQALYETHCGNCHMENGEGLKSLIPPLAGSDYLTNHPEKIACIIRYGQSGEITVNGTTYNQSMPGIPQLTEVEIANIINYINQQWGNDAKPVSAATVKKHLKNCKNSQP
ncbi:cytochrome c [Rapidithrix thailandica]|uniref:Cytochrome c n=1 Tax=Rapidithrix thailandica TaxID=413964 RepID=A0AAW9SFG7_9BACT